jgi:hypothetical protein
MKLNILSVKIVSKLWGNLGNCVDLGEWAKIIGCFFLFWKEAARQSGFRGNGITKQGCQIFSWYNVPK